MRICMPTVAESGLDALLSRHFGRAPYFTVVDEATGEVTALANTGAAHDQGCAPAELLARAGVQAVVCRQLGRGALLRLQELGIRVYLTESGDVATAVAEWRAGSLAEAALDQLTRGRIHDCGQSHGHHHHQGD